MRMKHKNARMDAFKKIIMQRFRNILDPEAQTKNLLHRNASHKLDKRKRKNSNNEEVQEHRSRRYAFKGFIHREEEIVYKKNPKCETE